MGDFSPPPTRLCRTLPGSEQLSDLSLNQRVPGSSPGAPTNKIKHLTSGAVCDLPRICGWEEHGKIRRQMRVKARAEASDESSTKHASRACLAQFIRTPSPKH